MQIRDIHISTKTPNGIGRFVGSIEPIAGHAFLHDW